MRYKVPVFLGFLLCIFIFGIEGNNSTDKKPTYLGQDEQHMCEDCHPKIAEQLFHTIHLKAFDNPKNSLEARGCEVCHGPASLHVANPKDFGGIITFKPHSKNTPKEKNGQCLQCHTGKELFFWDGSPHELNKLACMDCHRLTREVSESGMLKFADEKKVCWQCHSKGMGSLASFSHIPEGSQIKCSDCHNPHGSDGEKLLRSSTPNQICFRCHADKRGPFLFEHPPVVENCLNCHKIHNSINPKLLIVRAPRLCLQCHSDPPSFHHFDKLESRFIYNKSCLNCHSMIHGSNSPAGGRFQR